MLTHPMKSLILTTLAALLCACYSSCAYSSYAAKPCADGGPHLWGQWSLNRDGDRLGGTGLPFQDRKCERCGIVEESY